MDNQTSIKWYVLQVFSGNENKVELTIQKLKLTSLKSFLPQKKLKIKKKGRFNDVITPLYPGYIFIVGKWDLNEAKQILLIKNTIKFVGGTISPGYLQKEEENIIKKIINIKDGIAEYSKAVKVGTKIKIISGPLQELKGEIISVDRRKQRAVVKMPLLNTTVNVTLGFEYIDKEK